jgi:hypothetical protein
VVETSKKLDTDYSEVTANLLAELVSLQRAGDNATARAAVAAAERTTSPSNSDVWVNGLWFTSLVLALATALFAVLAKQWIRQYSSVIIGPPRDRAYVRHFRWEAFQKWRVQTIIGLLPTILHASLALFLAGLIVFLYPLHQTMAQVVLGLSIVIFGAYSISTILPIISPRCPYRTQLSILLNWPARVFVFIFWQILHQLDKGAVFVWNQSYMRCLWCLLRSEWISYEKYSKWQTRSSPNQKLKSAADDASKKCSQAAKDVERDAAFAVKEIPARAPDLLIWLKQNSVNSSARRIILQCIGTCTMGPHGTDSLYSRLEWVEQLEAAASQDRLEQEQLERIRHSSCAVISCLKEGCRLTTSGFTARETKLPTFELALFVLYYVGIHIYSWPEYLPCSLGVSLPGHSVLLFEVDSKREKHYYPIRIIEFYDSANPPRLSHHIWKCLDEAGYLPEIQDADRGVWRTVLEEIEQNRLDYIKFLEYPDTHQQPISLAQYFAPALAKRRWLQELSYDENNYLMLWYSKHNTSAQQLWTTCFRSRLGKGVNAIARMLRLSHSQDPKKSVASWSVTSNSIAQMSLRIAQSRNDSSELSMDGGVPSQAGEPFEEDLNSGKGLIEGGASDGVISQSVLSLAGFFKTAEGGTRPNVDNVVDSGMSSKVGNAFGQAKESTNVRNEGAEADDGRQKMSDTDSV